MRIEQKFKETFVGWWPLERKPHLVKWKTVCIDKRKGDLGIKDLVKFDNALLCNWSWWFGNEKEALWNQVVRGKYGEEKKGWCTKEVKGGYGIGVWKAIGKEWNLAASKKSFVVGNERRVLFWKDKWCGPIPLSIAFPTLNAITGSNRL